MDINAVLETVLGQIPNLAIAVYALTWAGRVIERLLENQQKLIEQLSARPATSIDTMPPTAPSKKSSGDAKTPPSLN